MSRADAQAFVTMLAAYDPWDRNDRKPVLWDPIAPARYQADHPWTPDRAAALFAGLSEADRAGLWPSVHDWLRPRGTTLGHGFELWLVVILASRIRTVQLWYTRFPHTGTSEVIVLQIRWKNT